MSAGDTAMSPQRESNDSSVSSFAVARRFARYLVPYWSISVLAFLTLLGQVLMDTLSPWPIKFVFDSVIGKHHIAGWPGHVARSIAGTDRFALLNLIVVVFIGIAVLGALFTYANTVLVSQVGQRFVYDIRRDLFAHVQRLSLQFHGSRRSGDLMSRLTGDITSLQDLVVIGASNAVGNGMTITLMVVVMLRLDWRYTLVALVIVPFMYLAARYYRTAIKQASRQVRRSEGQVSSIVQEVISSIRVVKAFAREDFEQERFEQQTTQSVQANLRTARLQAQFAPIISILATLSMVVVLWLGVREVVARRLTAGELLVFVSYFRALSSPLRQLAKLSTITARGTASAERVLEILDTIPDVQDLPNAKPAASFRGDIRFESVSFGYDPSNLVLHDLSFHISAGSTVALIGATGSGKTTTASLIPRFYDPVRGAVLIDGHDARTFTLRSLRAQISLVLQEAVLFQGTVYDNIAYGNLNATPKEIYSAADMANVAEFVNKLPEGYDTTIGERGASLSGGQRQRIAIARAIVRKAPILVLDEPTIGLDAETEYLVMEALRRLMSRCTSIVIAHHLATIREADTIVVLENGRIIEQGPHHELLASSGLYARLLQRQTGESSSPTVERKLIV